MCGILAVIFNSFHQVSRRYLIHQLKKIHWRGPDKTSDQKVAENLYMGFTRLSINDLSQLGDQPLVTGPITLICNGEIYNYKKLRDQNNFVLKGSSDCEIINHLYLKYGIDSLLQMLEGYFSFVLHDSRNNSTYVARDFFGVRPTFIGTDKQGNTAFASEAKCLVDWCSDVKPFPPSHYWDSKTQTFTRYFKLQNELRRSEDILGFDLEKQKSIIKNNFYNAVEKRLLSDRTIGSFLSGGLDSSIVTAILSRIFGKYHLNTFSIGMDGAPDLKYAGEVSAHCKTSHHHVEFTPEDGIDVLEDVIYALETYDVTTIRASIGMYLLSKYIRKHSDCAVIFSGEGSDEITQGYMYFHLQPSNIEGAVESQRLIEDLYLYDNLRCDRTTAANGLEVRVPFLDHIFVQSYLQLPVDIRCPINKIEKYTFRSLWKDDNLLPDNVLWRKKVAFSDGVSSTKKSFHILLQNFVETIISDQEFLQEREMYSPRPISKEALYYRRIYNKYYENFNLIPYYWQPKWTGQDNPDPSARNLNFYNED